MIKIIRYWIIKTVGTSQGEANSLLILVSALILAIIFPPFFYQYFTTSYANHVSDQRILDSLLTQIQANDKHILSKKAVRIAHEKFDPNNASHQLLQSNGIPTHLAKRIINYREKGGVFTKKEDLQKIYGIGDKLYKSLVPYISIHAINSPQNTSRQPRRASSIYKNKPFYKKEITAFDLNDADSSTFRQVRGIGDKLSARLVSFRNKLGGFVSADQLYEVYGLPPQVVDSLLSYGSIATNFTPVQININTDTIGDLSAHPYISYRLATLIMSFRKAHGSYTRVDQLKEIDAISDSIYQVISAYLKVSDTFDEHITLAQKSIH